MAEITATMVKELRAVTGAGPLDCKKALVEVDGDMQKAIDYLREKGIAKAQKKLSKGRTMSEGVIEVYQHFNKRQASMVEVNCETDFVASTDAFQKLAKDIALHVASMRPQYVRREDIPQDVIDQERDILSRSEDLEGKPEEIKARITDGRLDKWYQGIVLMEQEFLKDEAITVAKLIEQAVAELGESIAVTRFANYVVGENIGDDSDSDDDE